MDINRVDPTLRSALAARPVRDLTTPDGLRAAAQASRTAEPVEVEGVARREAFAADVPLRVWVPERASGAGLLWMHGGGLVLGTPVADDLFLGETARQLGVTIVSVDYRLAPEHPFPAALDDAHAGWEWLVAHAPELSLDAARLAIGGRSAGGGLAAALVQRLHDEGARPAAETAETPGAPEAPEAPMTAGAAEVPKTAETPGSAGSPVKVAAQWLWVPMLDDRTAFEEERDAADNFVWPNRFNRVGWQSYLGDAFGSEHSPAYAVPARRDDLSGLPPAWLSIGDIDLFFDEVRSYADRLAASGVDVTLEIVQGAPHGFETWAQGSELAQDLFARARAWLGRKLAAD